MTYTTSDYRRDLEQELLKGYDPIRIARATFNIYQIHCLQVNQDLYKKMFEVIAMEEGPEFEFSETEFREFVRNLVDDSSLPN